jgi:hypothetical protein
MLTNYGSFFDQEEPPVPVIECVSEYNNSEPYEVDQSAIFKTEDGRYIGVVISGCS